MTVFEAQQRSRSNTLRVVPSCNRINRPKMQLPTQCLGIVVIINGMVKKLLKEGHQVGEYCPMVVR